WRLRESVLCPPSSVVWSRFCPIVSAYLRPGVSGSRLGTWRDFASLRQRSPVLRSPPAPAVAGSRTPVAGPPASPAPSPAPAPPRGEGGARPARPPAGGGGDSAGPQIRRAGAAGRLAQPQSGSPRHHRPRPRLSVERPDLPRVQPYRLRGQPPADRSRVVLPQ